MRRRAAQLDLMIRTTTTQTLAAELKVDKIEAANLLDDAAGDWTAAQVTRHSPAALCCLLCSLPTLFISRCVAVSNLS